MTDARFMDLPAKKFPFTIYAYPQSSRRDDDLVWARHVSGPGVVSIPGVAATGQPVRLVVRYGDGTVSRHGDVSQRGQI